jgi:hypothetical protein
MNIPSVLTAGDTFDWTDSLSDYPAPTWTLKYSLWKYGKAVIPITASASGSDHAVSVAPSVSTAYAAGDWQWTAYVEKGSGGTLERYTIATGRVTIKPNVSAVSSSADLRSHAQIMLDGIEATLQGRATHADLSLTINGKSIAFLKPSELESWRNTYRREVNKENNVSSVVRIQFGSA